MQKMKVLLVTAILSSCIVMNVKAQQTDTVHIKGKVVTIDTIKLYVVIKVKVKKNSKLLTVLSPIDEKSSMIIGKKDSSLVTVGRTYVFDALKTIRLRVDKERYLFLDFREYWYGNVKVVEAGEPLYVALNAYKYYIYR